MKRLVSIIVIATYLSGCTSLTRVDAPRNQLATEIQAGDTLVIWTKDGRKNRFAVTTVTEDSVCGPDECVQTDNITYVERVDVSTAKSVGLVLLLVLAVGAAALATKSMPLVGFPALRP